MNADFTPLLPPPSASAPAPVESPEPQPTGHEPRLTVERAGDHITHITVHCACGEKIELACEH